MGACRLLSWTKRASFADTGEWKSALFYMGLVWSFPSSWGWTNECWSFFAVLALDGILKALVGLSWATLPTVARCRTGANEFMSAYWHST